jgi:DNA-binding response OmpR family regulator
MSQVVATVDEQVAPRVLIVDDDPDILSTTRAALESAGYDVWSADSAEAAMKCFVDRGVPHLAIIDINMPGADGITLSRQIKACCDMPIVMMTSETDARSVVTALDEFAEDYITKPVELPVLVARVTRVLRRIRDFSYAVEPMMAIDDRLGIEFTRCRALVDGHEVALTPTETKLLHILLRDAGRTVRSEYLLQRLWPLEEVFEDTLRVHVCRLRAKIEEDSRKPKYVVTVRGQGYRFPGREERDSANQPGPSETGRGGRRGDRGRRK